MTDIATGWTENRSLRNKARRWVIAAMDDIARCMPFKIIGVDSDNGSEFINHHLLAWCEKRKITFTRGRPNVSNDGAHVEQKNWALVGYHATSLRYCRERICAAWTQKYSGALFGDELGSVGPAVINDAAGRSQHQLDVVGIERGRRGERKPPRVVVLGEAKSRTAGAPSRTWPGWITSATCCGTAEYPSMVCIWFCSVAAGSRRHSGGGCPTRLRWSSEPPQAPSGTPNTSRTPTVTADDERMS